MAYAKYAGGCTKWKLIFMMDVSQAKHELRKEILRQRIYGRHRRQPEITTKHGKLKSHKRYDQSNLNVDDLVTLGTLTEVNQEKKKYFS